MREVYIAYGSNMNHDQMHVRCPEAQYIGSGMLKDHRLVFRNVADVEYDTASKTPVALWAVTYNCRRSLDRYEGAPRLYTRVYNRDEFIREDYMKVRHLSVGQVCLARGADKLFARSEPLPMFMYQMTEAHCDRYEEPHYAYYEGILEGYKHCGLEKTHSLAMSVAASALKGKSRKEGWFDYLHSPSRPQRV